MVELAPSYFFGASDWNGTVPFSWPDHSVLALVPALKGYFASLGPARIDGEVAPSAHIEGPVWLHETATIGPNSFVRGPVFLGPGAAIGHAAQVRDGVVLGRDAYVGHCSEAARSILLAESSARHHCVILDSVIGGEVQVGGFFGTAVTKVTVDIKEVLGGAPLRLSYGDTEVVAPASKVGAIVGSACRLAANILTMPGTLIGPRSVVLPTPTLGGFHPAGSFVADSGALAT